MIYHTHQPVHRSLLLVYYFWLARQRKRLRSASMFVQFLLIACHLNKNSRDLIRTVRTLTNDAQFSSFKQVLGKMLHIISYRIVSIRTPGKR